MSVAAAGFAVTPLQSDDGTDVVDAVVALWERCGLTRPWNDPRADIALARRGDNAAVLLGREGDRLVAAMMVGHDGHRGWFYYLGVEPARRGAGFGRALTAEAEDWLRARGIEKAMLMVRADNAQVAAFYNALGYEAQERVVFARWLDGREPTP